MRNLVLAILIAISFYYVGANNGYDIGYSSGVADRMIIDMQKDKISCEYVK